MKIFISWSGERSRLVGELLDRWIRCVLQAADPWISSNDIDRGSLWFTEVNDKLREISIGIICLTKENKDKPWILFEAGALIKGLSTNRVCTLLVDLAPEDVKDPLAQFNHTVPDKDGIRKLVRTLNLSLGEAQLKDNILSDVFETYYPRFEKEFNEILENTPETTPTIERDQDDILNEILSVIRGLEKRVRGIEETASLQKVYSKSHFPERDLIWATLDKDDNTIFTIKAIEEVTREKKPLRKVIPKPKSDDTKN